MLATQLLWVNLVTDGLPAIGLGVDPAVPGLMSRPPDKERDILGVSHQLRLVWQGAILALGVMGVYVWGYTIQGNEWEYVRTVAFTTLVVTQLFHIFNVRAQGTTAFAVGFTSNRLLLWGVFGSLDAAGAGHLHAGREQALRRPAHPCRRLAPGRLDGSDPVPGDRPHQAVDADPASRLGGGTRLMATVRTLQLITTFLAVAAGVFAVVVVVLSAGWGEPDEGLATLGMILAGAVGLAGLVIVLVWRNRATAMRREPAKVVTGYMISAAVAEAGMLVGFVFSLASESRNPFWLGGAVYVASLFVLVTALSQIETREPAR